jgi:hypothetical protein
MPLLMRNLIYNCKLNCSFKETFNTIFTSTNVKQRFISHFMSALVPIYNCSSNPQCKPILPVLWVVNTRHRAVAAELVVFSR